MRTKGETQERVGNQRRLKGQIRQRQIWPVYPKKGVGIRPQHMRFPGDVESTQSVMAMGKTNQIASLALTGNRQKHASHSVDEPKSITRGWTLLYYWS